MEFVIIAIIVIGVIALIAYPLFTASRVETMQAPDTLDALLAQKDSAYDTLRDLDFDFQLGKLSPSDYTALRDKYKARAAALLQQIDAVAGNGHAADADAEIEAQVARLRSARGARSTDADAIEQQVARLRAAKGTPKGLRCTNCGTPYHAGDQYCAKCGTKLES